MRESALERKLVAACKAKGALCLKWVSPGTPGVPDRIVITKSGHVVFVEMKAPGGKVSPIQIRFFKELRARNKFPIIIGSENTLEEFASIFL